MNDEALIVKSINKVCIRALLQDAFYGRLVMQLPKVIDPDATQASISLWKAQVLSFVVSPKQWLSLDDTERLVLIKRAVLAFIFTQDLVIGRSFSNFSAQLSVTLLLQRYLPQALPDTALSFAEITSLAQQYQISFLEDQAPSYYQQQLVSLLSLISKSPLSINQLPAALASTQIRLQRLAKSKVYFEYDSQGNNNSLATQKIVAYQATPLLQKTLAQYPLSSSAEHHFPRSVIEKIVSPKHKYKTIFHWKRRLHLFAHSSRKTILRSTIHRPSKRYHTRPGHKITQAQKIWVAIDTSGSISAEELGIFFQEINQIWRSGATVFILESDAKIQKKYRYRGHPPKHIQGRGATRFTPVLKLAKKQQKLDALIYFTDGHGPVPNHNPHCPLLWVITPKGIAAQSRQWQQLPGKKIKISS